MIFSAFPSVAEMSKSVVAAPSLSHDPNDDIAAAIAAVAAGESDLKMPSAAVEVEQV